MAEASGTDRVNHILDMLGGNAVLLPIRAGTKRPELTGWSNFSEKEMADPKYLAQFNNGGNIGVLLGLNSGGLCTIDIDDDQYIELFLKENPKLRSTLRTKRLKGCNFWLWVSGEYPGVTPFHHARLKNPKGGALSLGEWRSTGGQTVIQGQADGIPYRCEVDAKPIHIEFTDLIWPEWIGDPPHVEIEEEKGEASNSSLDLEKLTLFRKSDSGFIWAACPACRKAGEDSIGNHLLITPEGKFGCAKYPKHKGHRKEIWALAGIPKPKREENTETEAPEWFERHFGSEKEEIIEPLTILSFEEIYALPDDPDDMLLGDNLLNKGAPLVIAGQGGVGKSRLLFQFIACCKMGLKKFLIWDIHPGAYDLKWLILQTENRKKRLKSEYDRLRRQMSDDQWGKFNSEVLCLCPSKAQDLMLGLEDPKAVKRIKMALEKFTPGAVACDPLGEFSVGDLNKDVDMRNTILTLNRTISSGNPDRCLVISHHALTGEAGITKAIGYDRASFARNSKVLFNWTRAQINVAPMLQENNDQLAVTCGKCSDGKEFQSFCIRLNSDTMWYECDPTVDVAAWHKDLKAGKKGSPVITSEKVRELCELAGSTKPELSKQIIEESGCLRPNAYRYMKTAELDGQIKWNSERKLFFKN